MAGPTPHRSRCAGSGRDAGSFRGALEITLDVQDRRTNDSIRPNQLTSVLTKSAGSTDQVVKSRCSVKTRAGSPSCSARTHVRSMRPTAADAGPPVSQDHSVCTWVSQASSADMTGARARLERHTRPPAALLDRLGPLFRWNFSHTTTVMRNGSRSLVKRIVPTSYSPNR